MLIDNLEKKIHYKFKDINLLKEALIHSSHLSNNSQKSIKNYERLEFLGDRVLGLVLAEYFFKLFPDANEGLLNGYLQKYANQNTLAEYANKINYLILSNLKKGII